MVMKARTFLLMMFTALALFLIIDKANAYTNEATRHLVRTFQFVENETVNNAVFISEIQLPDISIGFAIQVNVSDCGGLCDGLIQVLSSVNNITYIPVDGCDVAISDDGDIILNVPAIYWPFLRLQYTENATVNTVINAWMSVKEDIGG